MPMAMRVARTPSGLSSRARYTAVASAFDRGVGGEDDLLHRAVLQPRE